MLDDTVSDWMTGASLSKGGGGSRSWRVSITVVCPAPMVTPDARPSKRSTPAASKALATNSRPLPTGMEDTVPLQPLPSLASAPVMGAIPGPDTPTVTWVMLAALADWTMATSRALPVSGVSPPQAMTAHTSPSTRTSASRFIPRMEIPSDRPEDRRGWGNGIAGVTDA
ncbi:hypothetical protein D7Y04_37330 [Corallococcus sp. AB038B]|nr:hypothetical protein D7Y04_37330 [Corallococcus sp. AB038B]